MQRLKCLVGLHSWLATPAVYADETAERLAIPLESGSRTCLHCDKTQVEDRHCLGLNPPEYYSTWHTTQLRT